MSAKIHAVTHLAMYTDAKGGGLTDVAHIQLQGFTLVDNGDLAHLRQIASCMDADPIAPHIVDVLELALQALKGARGGAPTSVKGKLAVQAIRDLLRAAPPASN